MQKEHTDVVYEMDNLPPLTAEDREALLWLRNLPDEDIDYSDIPRLTDQQLSEFRRGDHYRPVKRQITARLDSDVLAWLKSQGKGYQSRMNAILRREMLAQLAAKR